MGDEESGPSKKTISAFGGRIQVERPDFYFTPTESYGVLGWIETAIKVIASICAIITLVGVDVGLVVSTYVRGLRLAQVIIISILLLYYLLIPVHRYLEGEVFALCFSLLQLVTHFFFMMGVIFSTTPGDWIFTYAFLMVLGELTKIIFLFVRKDFEQRYMKRPVLLIVAIVVTAVYITLLVLQIVVWMTEYPPDSGV